jgi:hypothetical protein
MGSDSYSLHPTYYIGQIHAGSIRISCAILRIGRSRVVDKALQEKETSVHGSERRMGGLAAAQPMSHLEFFFFFFSSS